MSIVLHLHAYNRHTSDSTNKHPPNKYRIIFYVDFFIISSIGGETERERVAEKDYENRKYSELRHHTTKAMSKWLSKTKQITRPRESARLKTNACECDENKYKEIGMKTILFPCAFVRVFVRIYICRSLFANLNPICWLNLGAYECYSISCGTIERHWNA